MKLTRIMVIVAMLSLMAPATAELNDYQTGVLEGLKSGFVMGQAYQQSMDGKIDNGRYNLMVDNYNKGIQAIFAGNQTTINSLLMVHASTGLPGIVNVGATTKPIHAIDTSFNQTRVIPPENPNARYGDLPLSAVYTWGSNNNTAIPSVAVPGAGDALGGV